MAKTYTNVGVTKVTLAKPATVPASPAALNVQHHSHPSITAAAAAQGAAAQRRIDTMSPAGTDAAATAKAEARTGETSPLRVRP